MPRRGQYSPAADNSHGALLPEDFAQRVSVNLHKCSAGAGIFEKVQT
jgi:hypothetical protein